LRATLATGLLGEKVLRPVAARLNGIKGLEVSIKTVVNSFFGEQVTVAGLLTGSDLLDQIKPEETGDLLVLPSVMVKKEEGVFLDDRTPEEIAAKLKVKVAVVDGPRQLVDVLIWR
jgi:NifB/MoaA-like Fe-S oxidoreductase